jgi:hypothetical protein
MKNISRFIKGQMTVILLMLFPLLTGMASCQKDKTHELDITKFQWELKLITQNDVEHKKPNEAFQNPDAYILRFESDSTFRLNFSINTGYGNYLISTNGNIAIDSYDNITRAAMSDFDDKLLYVFRIMTSYTVKGKALTFKGNNSGVEFKKK